MLARYHKQLFDEMTGIFGHLTQILKDICDNRVNDIVFLTNIQKQLVDIGTVLEEKWNLKETVIIHDIENLAELIYRIAQIDETDKDNYYFEIGEIANSLLQSLSSSISINNSRMALVLVIKNEARYIEEWIEFHNMLGVDHFYIYDNESTDDLLSRLKKYIDIGLVTYTYWEGKQAQKASYNHAIEHYKYDTEYMGFIDTDEFLFPVSGDSIPDVVEDIINMHNSRSAKYVLAGGIGVNWRSYGTSYHKEIVDGLVIDNFRMRAYDDYEQNVHIKVIVKPELVKGFLKNPHNVIYNDDVHVTISEYGSTIPSAFFYDGRCEKLRINHYYTRSEEELSYKMNVRGWPDISEELRKEYAKSFEYRLKTGNDMKDDIVDRFIEPLKRRMDIEK